MITKAHEDQIMLCRRQSAEIETLKEKLAQMDAVNRIRTTDMANLYTELSQSHHDIRKLKNELFNFKTPENVKFNTKGMFKLYQFPQPMQGI